MSVDIFESINQQINGVKPIKISGKINTIKGGVVECKGIAPFVTMGAVCKIRAQDHSEKYLMSEVIGFHHDTVIIMPFGDLEGIGIGDRVEVCTSENYVFPDLSWRGRILNGFAEPLDSLGELKSGKEKYFLKSKPPTSQNRNLLDGKIDLGIRSINTFASCCYGQRMGVFSGSGVGKSMLISMMAKFASADVKVIGLIGERSREVKEFIHEYLGEDGLKNSVIIVATGDEPALMRKRAAYLTKTISEYFRNQGLEVLCIMDSITRFAMAQREIGLAVGEPPTAKGYTPSVFSELPKLLERSGPGTKGVHITGLFTVLVEGDDPNEPISDAVRSTLDGHIVLDRAIAERGRYPAVDILKSVSRMLPKCNTDFENRLLIYARKMLAIYNDMAEMIRIGAYKKGTDPEVDLAIKHYDKIEQFLSQQPNERATMQEGYDMLSQILDIKPQ